MKKLFPYAIIAVVGLLSFASCKKSSTSSTCTCHYTSGFTNKDTTFSVTAPAGTSLGTYCSEDNTAIQAAYGTATSGCSL